MNPHDLRASVIVPTLNRRSFLPTVIAPLLEDPATAEVIFVVDGGDDDTPEYLTELSTTDPRIRHVVQQNSGENAARLRGVREATFDIVVLLDDDVVASPGLITGHCHWHPQDSRRLVLGYMPTAIPTPRQPGQAAIHLYAQDYEHVCRLFESGADTVFTNFWAGNMSMRREIAETTLARPVNRLAMNADLQFGLYCREAGLEPIFDRSLRASHHYQRSLEKFAEQARRSGECHIQLGQEFPELAAQLQPLDSHSLQELIVAQTLGHPAIHQFSAPFFLAVSRLAGRLKLWQLETLSARVLRLIELTYGFRRPRIN